MIATYHEITADFSVHNRHGFKSLMGPVYKPDGECACLVQASGRGVDSLDGCDTVDTWGRGSTRSDMQVDARANSDGRRGGRAANGSEQIVTWEGRGVTCMCREGGGWAGRG